MVYYQGALRVTAQFENHIYTVFSLCVENNVSRNIYPFSSKTSKMNNVSRNIYSFSCKTSKMNTIAISGLK